MMPLWKIRNRLSGGLVDPRELGRVVGKGRKVVRVWALFGFTILKETDIDRPELRDVSMT